jgi:hypothetical protein
LGGAKPLGRAVYLVVDHPGHWWAGSLMEKLVFTGVNLFDVRVIMVIMCVPVEELLC